MEFGQYLASRRRYKTTVNLQNPAADELIELLQLHLKTVAKWLNGYMNRADMLRAMKFFDEIFPGQYAPTVGRLVYRGQAGSKFDDSPRSYTYTSKVAENFSCNIWNWSNQPAILIRRKVCFSCPDKDAFSGSLDIGKLMKAYAGHQYAGEREVILLNTEPRGSTARIDEMEC